MPTYIVNLTESHFTSGKDTEGAGTVDATLGVGYVSAHSHGRYAPMDQEMKFSTATQENVFRRRWWLNTRGCPPVKYPDGTTGASAEIYVPFWAWPLEALHRAVFGRPGI